MIKKVLLFLLIAQFGITQNASTAQSNGLYSMSDFGAKCDGKTDDTAALNSACTAAEAVGGIAFVPASVNGCIIAGKLNPLTAKMVLSGVVKNQYTIGSSLKFTSNGGGPCGPGVNGYIQIQQSGVVINGIIWSTNQPNAGTCMLNVSKAAGEVSNAGLYNSSFNGGSATSTNYGIWIDAADTFRLENNILGNVVSMFYHGGVHGLIKVVMENNTFTQCTTSKGYMVSTDNGGEVDSIDIEKNVFEGSNICNNGIKTDCLNASGGCKIALNWMGDAGTTNPGTWLYTSGSIVEANKIIGPPGSTSHGIVVAGGATAQSTRLAGNTVQSPVLIVGDAILESNHFTSTISMQNSYIWSFGNSFNKGTYNSFNCVSGAGTCLLWNQNRADQSSGVAANVTQKQ